MKKGQKFILTNQQPYGVIGNDVETIPEFIEIEIIEEKSGPVGGFSGKVYDGVMGYLAKGSDEYNYSMNWPSFYEGYVHPCWVRYASDVDFDKLSETEKNKLISDYLWTDVVHVQCFKPPKFMNSFSIKLKFCEKHQRLYYDECFYCKHAPNFVPRIMLTEENGNWLGWY